MIEVRGLSKRYGGAVTVDALSFDVAPGTVTGFLDPNGAGKRTTMRMTLGLDHPSAGSARCWTRRPSTGKDGAGAPALYEAS